MRVEGAACSDATPTIEMRRSKSNPSGEEHASKTVLQRKNRQTSQEIANPSNPLISIAQRVCVVL